jgi:hypothetical protein
MSQDKVSLLRDPSVGVSTSSDNRNYDSVVKTASIWRGQFDDLFYQQEQQPQVQEANVQIDSSPRRFPQYVAALTGKNSTFGGFAKKKMPARVHRALENSF